MSRTQFSITNFTDPLQSGVRPFRIRRVPIPEAANIIHSLQEELNNHNGGHNPHNAVATFPVHRATLIAPRGIMKRNPRFLRRNSRKVQFLWENQGSAVSFCKNLEPIETFYGNFVRRRPLFRGGIENPRSKAFKTGSRLLQWFQVLETTLDILDGYKSDNFSDVYTENDKRSHHLQCRSRTRLGKSYWTSAMRTLAMEYIYSGRDSLGDIFSSSPEITPLNTAPEKTVISPKILKSQKISETA